MFSSGKQLPNRTSAFGPLTTLSPTRRPNGAMITLLAIGIRQERNARRAVRIVLERHDASRNPVLFALKVNLAILAQASTASMANRDLTLSVASTLFAKLDDQAAFRPIFGNVLECIAAHPAPAR
jgi:hypothetical protein